jgi:L-alanine-DL-glutamate epimerase-like enolase superfamily enzyme
VSGSRIRQVEVFAIRAPRKEAVRSGLNLADPVTASEFGVVRLLTEDGVEGLGEISITFPRIGHSLCHAARKLIAPAITGLDALAIPTVLAEVDRVLGGELSAPYLRAAFEMALLDATGRHFGVPVWALLGGRRRDRAALAWGIYQKSPEEMASDAAAGRAAGFQAIKLKVGRELAADLAAVTAVARAVDVPLRLDANMAWRTVPDAVHAMRTLADAAPVAWFEQPLGRRNLEGLRALRLQTGLPASGTSTSAKRAASAPPPKSSRWPPLSGCPASSAVRPKWASPRRPAPIWRWRCRNCLTRLRHSARCATSATSSRAPG